MMTEYTLFTTLAFHHIIVGGALIMCLMTINALFQLTAEMRSWLWMTAFIAATLLPFSLFSSSVVFPSSSSTQSLSQASEVISEQMPQLALLTENKNEIATGWHMPSEIVFQFSELLSVFIAIWLCGSFWRGYQVFAAYLRTRKLLKGSVPIALKGELFSSVKDNLFSSTAISSPMVVGLVSPKIILPQTIISQMSNEQLAPIVLHEQAHIQRHDIWFGLFQELIAIIFWWSPVIRLLNRKIHVERELACDLRAAKQLSNGKQYAQSLIDCAKLMITEHRSVLAMGLFSQKKELSHRVTQVLKSKTIKTPNMLIVLGVCLGLTATTIKATQVFSPKISVSAAASDGKHFSLLPASEGEQLIDAVMNNDIDRIAQMQNEGVDINTPAVGDGTALIIAVKTNNQRMVQELINLGADVNQSSRGDGNPLITAAMKNNITLAQLLIDNGANVNQIVPRDETPLINATRRGLLEMSQLLVNNGADVNLSVKTGLSDGNVTRSPLNMASTEAMKTYLLDNGATQ